MWPGIPSSCRCTRKNSGARGLTGSTRSGRKAGYSGAPWTDRRHHAHSCRRLMFLCRRGRTAGGGVPAPGLADPQNRLSKCPRPRLHPVLLAGALCASLSRRQTVGGSADVKMLFFVTPDCGAERGHSSSSGSSWIFSRDRGLLPHPVVCMTLRMRILQGVSHFSPFEKKCEVGLTLGVGTAPRVEPHPRGELMRTRMLQGELLAVFVDFWVSSSWTQLFTCPLRP